MNNAFHGQIHLFFTRRCFSHIHVYFRAKDNPSPIPGKYCTIMSLRLSEEHLWESVYCEDSTATVAVCQYPWLPDDYVEGKFHIYASR